MKIKELFAATYNRLQGDVYRSYSSEWDDNEKSPYAIAVAWDRQSTIRELDDLFFRLGESQATQGRVLRFQSVLIKRAYRIVGSNVVYMHQPTDPTNILCEILAEELVASGFVTECKPKLLLPMIETQNAVTLTDLNETEAEAKPLDRLRMNEFVLSDDDKHIIHVLDCLADAEEDKKLKHTSTLHPNGKIKFLSSDECLRVIHHSLYTKKYYEAIEDRYRVKNEGQNIGAAIRRLIEKLEKGGVSGRRGGTMNSAGSDAVQGIREFHQFVRTLNDAEKNTLYASFATTNNIAPAFGQVWLRLLKRAAVAYDGIELSIQEIEDIELIGAESLEKAKQSICVEQAADDFRRILFANEELFDIYPENIEGAITASIERYEARVVAAKSELAAALKNDYFLVGSRYLSDHDVRFMRQAYQGLVKTVPDLCWAMRHVAGFVNLVGKEHIKGIVRNGYDQRQVLDLLPIGERAAFLATVLDRPVSGAPVNRHVFFHRNENRKRKRSDEDHDEKNDASRRSGRFVN